MAAVQVTAHSSQLEVLAIKTPEVSTICRGTGSKENGYEIYQLIILMILDFYGVNWKDAQIRECSELLYDDWYFLTLAELKHFTLRAKTGHYAGRNFNPSFLNPVTLIDWMGQYGVESLKHREQNHLMQSSDERYNERWASHDERKTERVGEIYLDAEMNNIKEQLKNKQDGK